jgi:hypothetical protein
VPHTHTHTHPSNITVKLIRFHWLCGNLFYYVLFCIFYIQWRPEKASDEIGWRVVIAGRWTQARSVDSAVEVYSLLC